MVALLLLLILPFNDTLVDRVDVIEFNKFCDATNKPIFDQVLYWDYSTERPTIRAWHLDKGKNILSKVGNEWHYQRFDGDKPRLIIAKAVMRTRTNYDPELINREVLPKEERINLSNLMKDQR